LKVELKKKKKRKHTNPLLHGTEMKKEKKEQGCKEPSVGQDSFSIFLMLRYY
jgi:hypothetical protein